MRWARFQRLPIRHKLLALVLLPLLVVLPLLGLLLVAWGTVAFDQLLTTKVRSDLAVARGYFDQVLGNVGSSTASVAESQALHLAFQRNSDAVLVALLRKVQAREQLDFINLRRPDGSLRVTDHGIVDGETPADGLSDSQRLATRVNTSLEVVPPDVLEKLAPTLQSRVTVPLVPTVNAPPDDRNEERRAMVVLATAPVRDAQGRLLGYLQGGLLLNRNLAFIDHINEIVYPEGSLPFGSRGTATLFLDDVRVSTNVRLFGSDGAARAVGTRVSPSVRDAVLGRGSTWLDRAFVVDDWYVSGYQPLLDGAGRRVGMLYVGYLERPFTLLKYGVLAAIGVIFFTVMIGAALVSMRMARSIFGPIERMEQTMRHVESGALDARVGPLDSRDEIGRLAANLDRLLDVIDDNTTALDDKVAERTRELHAAQQQLLRSEKLATAGQLTASIAHEINNPIAVIQGNLDLVRDLLGADAGPVKAELRLIDEQIERMRLIVTQLLQFARPNEFAGYIENVDPVRALDDCLVLVGHLLSSSRIAVRRGFHATRLPAINRRELQQVLVNLMVNAIHAMPQGGTLTLSTCDRDDGGMEISVADTGAGLGPKLIAELFKPFVTRKQDGTGLGLWISRSIVERYGGDILAADRADGVAGAVFSVCLRCEPLAVAA